MATTQDLSRGMFLRYNGQLCQVVEYQHTMPGKGGAFYQVKMKNAITKFVQEEKGLTTVEYAVAGGVVAAAVATAFSDLGTAVETSADAIEAVI